MLDISVNLVPHGNRNEESTLARILIANVKVAEFSDYAFVIYEGRPITGQPIWYSGILRDYYRKAPVIDIVYKVLELYESKSAWIATRDYEKEVIQYLEEQAGIYD